MGTVGTVGTEDQKNIGYRGQEAQRTSERMGTEDQTSSAHRGPVEQ